MANTGENRNAIAGNAASTGRIMIDVITPFSNGEDLLQFRINNSTKLNKLFKAYLDRRPTNAQVQFLYYDRQSGKQIPLDVDSEMTPTLLGIGEYNLKCLCVYQMIVFVIYTIFMILGIVPWSFQLTYDMKRR